MGIILPMLLWGPPCLSQALEERKTIVTPLEGEQILAPCEYRLILPQPSKPVRAVWVIYDRGQDYLKWFHDSDIQELAREFDLGLLLAMHCRSKERDDMIVIPEKGVGRALFAALDQLAASENHPELRQVPLIHQGWSGAGSLVGRMANYRTARYLAGIAYAPGQYDPLGMDTIELSAASIRAPQLIVANGADPVNGTDRPYSYFKKYFDRGAPWTFAVQNRTSHCCLQNAQTLILEWLRGVLLLQPSSWGVRGFGYLTVEPSAVKDTWKQPVFNATAARASEKRNRARPGELQAGWLPSPRFSREWIKFEERAEPPAIWKP